MARFDVQKFLKGATIYECDASQITAKTMYLSNLGNQGDEDIRMWQTSLSFGDTHARLRYASLALKLPFSFDLSFRHPPPFSLRNSNLFQ
mmetsp:Transcript_123973/g.193516  ORF Transcript_123973/g.193516 Transcript_123973/m.193516 type:complete len:90 (+) Transcript_123973:182-451(+)